MGNRRRLLAGPLLCQAENKLESLAARISIELQASNNLVIKVKSLLRESSREAGGRIALRATL